MDFLAFLRQLHSEEEGSRIPMESFLKEKDGQKVQGKIAYNEEGHYILVGNKDSSLNITCILKGFFLNEAEVKINGKERNITIILHAPSEEESKEESIPVERDDSVSL